jgi:valyl-tRNA synthetase
MQPGKGFTNKIWNAFKLIKDGSFRDNTATRIFKGSYRYEAKLQQTLLEIEGNLRNTEYQKL